MCDIVTLAGRSMNPTDELAQDTLFLASRVYFLVQVPSYYLLTVMPKDFNMSNLRTIQHEMRVHMIFLLFQEEEESGLKP